MAKADIESTELTIQNLSDVDGLTQCVAVALSTGLHRYDSMQAISCQAVQLFDAVHSEATRLHCWSVQYWRQI